MIHKDNFTEDVYTALQQVDSQTLSHSIRANNIAEEIEHELNDSKHLLSDAALVHDIGKLYISSAILNKLKQLTTLERQIINYHSYYGYEILKNMNVDEKICKIVLYHHGVNPPVLNSIPGCEDKQIFVYARMLHTIDVYEALTSKRVYRNSYSREDALKLIENETDYDCNYDKFVINFLKQSRI